MDWERLYDRADYDRCAYLAGETMPDLVTRFVAERGPTETGASVGCGPAVTLFALAERFPATEWYGYDLSPSVVADNDALAAEEGLDNVTFAVAELPDLEAVDLEFDLVLCLAVLYFVRDTERALESLFDLLAPGGDLVVTLPTAALADHADREFEGRKREAFSLVIDRENLLTPEDVAATVDRTPTDFWAAVDATTDEVGETERERWATVVVRR